VVTRQIRHLLLIHIIVSFFNFNLNDFILFFRFVYSSEVFPTDSRNTRIGICAAVSRIGATLVPFVSQMVGNFSFINSHLIFLFKSRGSQLSVYGGAAFAAALFTLLLPETKDGDLPESINEVPKTKTLTLTHNPKKRIQLKH
jgi:hypothetical protein